MNFFNLVLILMVLWGCNPQDSSIEIKTGGIFKPITFGIENLDLSGQELDLGEWVTTDGAKPMTVTVTNHTLFPYTEIDLAFSPLNNEYTAMRFSPLETGESIFPGNGGTCGRTLPAGASCTILVELLPPIDGEYKEQLHLSFKNYVDFENHIGSIFILSGIPAELAIQEIPSRIRFGDIVGSDALVERTVVKTFTQAFTIKNVGGLSARDLIINNINLCKDTNDNYCDEYKDAYSIESLNCKNGDRIKKGETCDFILSYTPKNNSEIIPERYERIRYEGGLTVEYIKNPTGSRSTLGVNYDSLSSKIEGRLLSSPSVDLSNNGIGIVQGNRTFKDIRTINVGYRSLRINKIRVTKPKLTDTTDESWVMCVRQSQTNVLYCYDESIQGNPTLALKDFPFTITDLDQCVGDKATAPLIPIGSGCNFRITFQPSSLTHFVNPTNPTSFEQTDYDKLGKDVKVFVIYDSQWRDGENHCDNQVDCDPLPESGYRKTNFNFKLKAKRRSAARLEITSVKYNNVDLINVPNVNTEINNSASSTLDYLRTHDFGRLALLANSQKSKATAFKKLQIVFKNVGQDSAFLENIRFPLNDNTHVTIPHDTQVLSLLNDTNDCTDLSNPNHCYFRNARVLGDCTEISSEQLCTIEILFAPFVFTNSFDKNRAMYDYPFPEGATAEKFKSFKITYKNGSKYTDDPSLTTQNFQPLKSEIRLRATLTEKGQLEEIADDPDNFKTLNQGITRGSKITYKMRITNVGSGRVSKINMALGGTGYGFSAPKNCDVLPKDCRCYTDSTEDCRINSTSDSLPSDGECFLPLSWEQSGNTIQAEQTEASRLLAGIVSSQEKFDDASRTDYSNFTSTASFSLQSNISYFDCFKHTQSEIDNNKYGSNYNFTFGYPMAQPQFTTSVSPLYQPVKIVPYIPNTGIPANMSVPWHTTFAGRMAMPTSPGFVERVFYDLNNATSVNLDAATPFLETTQDSSMIMSARDSYQYPKNLYMSSSIQSILTANENNTIKYYYFMGSFPRYILGSGTTSYKVPFLLANANIANNGIASIKSIEISNVAGMGTINLRQVSNSVEQTPILTSNSSYNLAVPPNGIMGYTSEINPSLCTSGKCLYATNILLTYDTGKRDQDRVGTNWVKTCNTSTDTACERKIRLVVFAEVDSTLTSPLRFDSALVGVNLDGNSMKETCSNPLAEFTSGTWNQNAGGTALPLSSLKYNLPVPSNAAYDKRLVKITNTSTSNLRIKRVFLRSSTSNPAKYSAPGKDILQDSINTNATANCATITNNLCTNNIILTPNSSCYTSIRYLPTVGTFVNLSLSTLYTSETPQKPHFIYNVPLSFQPILPATLRPVSNTTGQPLSTVSTKTKLKSDGSIGVTDNQILGVFKVSVPQQTFTQTSPTQLVTMYQKVLNTTTTKASLLYQWRHFNNNMTGDPNPDQFETDANDSRSYVQIGENSLQFMKIFASRQCLYGTDVTPSSSSGFTNSEQNCYLKLVISLKHDNMLNTSNVSTSSSIDPYISRINYYSAGRSSLNSFVFYVEFNIKPAALAATNTNWGQITSVGLTTTLNFPAHTAVNPDIGNIVGYRVIRTKLITELSDFFNSSSANITRTDVFNTTLPEAVFTAPTTETGRIYHYKVLAIRQHQNFSKGDTWFGFPANKKDHFITDITNFNYVKVLVPPAGNLYFHTPKLLVETTRFGVMEDYSNALSRCTVKSISVKNGNTISSIPKSLINSSAWNVLAASDQVDPMWIFSSTPVLFSTMCPAMESFEYLDQTKRCFRSSIEISSGREIRGNLFEYDLLSPAYIEDTLYYGYSRCMTNLSSFL
jgi:hypothetical protein